MEKLELKHLAPYLPYKFKISIGKEVYNMRAISSDIYDSRLFFQTFRNAIGTAVYLKYYFEDYDNCKPILRHLSGLTKLERDKIWLDVIATDSDAYSRDQLEDLYTLEGVNHCPVMVYNYFLSKHIDVFGLIEAGLAIDINTLSPQNN